MNEGWASRGGRPGTNGSSRKLFHVTHDYLVGKGLTYFSGCMDWLVKPEYNTNQDITNIYCGRGEVVPVFVELEVAVPHLRPAWW
ncbi:hypothetical protein [Kribbella catacumbae]|uniref:hypothetical protein n=1 Tax=Kribbella catacumbae TaxID=460086 RepID=UPI00037DBF5F|nr:hypothetical protein [Kribbella catacumbae]